MANNIIGTVGVGAQSVKPDWNQNDPNAKDYIKNRPGGYTDDPVLLLDSFDVSTIVTMYSSNYFEMPNFIELKAGTGYNFAYEDGTVAEFVATQSGEYVECGDDAMDVSYDVNHRRVRLRCDTNAKRSYIMDNMRKDTHLLTVVEQSVIEIPEKYMPDGLRKTVNTLANDNESDPIVYFEDDTENGDLKSYSGGWKNWQKQNINGEVHEAVRRGILGPIRMFYSKNEQEGASQKQREYEAFECKRTLNEQFAEIQYWCPGIGAFIEWYSDDFAAIRYPTEFVLASSTSGSTKKFKITVDDTGTISATEVTD